VDWVGGSALTQASRNTTSAALGTGDSASRNAAKSALEKETFTCGNPLLWKLDAAHGVSSLYHFRTPTG
jgi:hypothetical protein